MNIINRSTQTIFWAIFDKDDAFAWSDFGIPRRGGQGQLVSGASVKADAAGSVQLQIRTTFDPTVRLPGGLALPPVFIRADRNKIYQDRDDVVFVQRATGRAR